MAGPICAIRYSLRTATHRYTRWVNWQSRQTAAEELYHDTTGPSTRHEAAFWIEQENLAAYPQQASERRTLSQQLDQMLVGRITMKPNADSAPNQRRKKKQP